MRRMVVAMVLFGGLGCGDNGDGDGDDAEPEVVCTTSSSRYDGRLERTESRMDGRGRPIATSSWDPQGLVSRATYVYDDAGRLVQEQLDSRSGSAAPDGAPDSMISIAYSGATAEVTTTDLRSGESRLTATYAFDDAGRPVRIVKDFALVDEVRAFQYEGDGRIRVADEQGLGYLPKTRYTEYAYGAGGGPSSMQATLDGQTFGWVFENQEAPGRVQVRALFEGMLWFTYLYEHDGDGRLTRAERDPYPEDNLEITYADDGAVTVLVGNFEQRTYSAECGVVVEVPRGRPAPSGPELEGHYVLPEIPSSYVMPSLAPF